MHIQPITERSMPLAVDGPAGSDRAASLGDDPASRAEAAPGAPSVSFGEVFGKILDGANRTDAEASGKVEALARGASDDLHGTMIAVKEADISIKLVGTIRNKLLDAFNELWRTSV